MPASNVSWAPPLTRFQTLWPGQFGVPGTDNTRGERLHCTGKVLYVDPNFPGTSDQRDGTDPSAPLTTVQAAIDLCTDYAGDVIVVMQNANWDYAGGTVYTTGITEEVMLDKAGVRLVGLSPGNFGVPWTPASNGGTCITVEAMDCCIEGFAFWQGAYAGCDAIYAEWDGATMFGENLVVRYCSFLDTVDKAIQIEYGWYNDIHHNLFYECDEHAIFVDPGGSGTAYNTIHDNVFHDCAVAMALQNCDGTHIYGNSIYNTNAQGAGAATDEGIDTTGGTGNQIYNNYFSCLLPVPAAGDWNDLNTAAASDAWINNHCMDGDTVTNPT